MKKICASASHTHLQCQRSNGGETFAFWGSRAEIITQDEEAETYRPGTETSKPEAEEAPRGQP